MGKSSHVASQSDKLLTVKILYEMAHNRSRYRMFEGWSCFMTGEANEVGQAEIFIAKYGPTVARETHRVFSF